MELGKDTTGEAVGRALLARTQLYRQVQGWFERFDVIVTPTLARTAIPIEERLFEPIEIEGQKVDTVRKAWYPYTHPFNLTGHPAITLPCGFHSDGLPVAIQLVGRRSEDARLLRVAALFEQARPWAARRPQIDGVLTRAYVFGLSTRVTSAGVGVSGTRRPSRGAIPEGATGRGCLLGNRGASRPQEPARASSESLARLSGTSRSRGLPFGTRVRRFLSWAILWLPAPPHRWSLAIAP